MPGQKDKPAQQEQPKEIVAKITNKAIANILSSKVHVDVSDLSLAAKMDIKVKQHVALKIPLHALVSYEDAQISQK